MIIPTLDEEAQIGGLLDHLEALSVGRDMELLVCDGGSRDRTREIARTRGVRVLRGPPGRARQMNRGARQAAGEALLFLHADTRLAAGSLEAVEQALSRPGVVGGTFPKRPFPEPPLLWLADRLVEWHQRFRVLLLGDRGIFVRRKIFEELGGFRDLPLMEDVDLGYRLERRGRLVQEGPPVTTSDRRFRQGGVARTLALMGRIWLRYHLGLPLDGAARRYRAYR